MQLNRFERRVIRFIRYMRRTWLNKLVAVTMSLLGLLSVIVSEGDATFLIFISLITVPMFFARESWLA